MPNMVDNERTTATVQPAGADGNVAPKRDLRFWMCLTSLMISSFIIALDLSGVSTALPVILHDLGGTQFEWIGSAYALAATAFLPLSGGLAQVFGRRGVMLLQIFLFAFGSALCGAAQSMNFLIGGRTVQGIGAGGIMSLTSIILSDLVPLQERGKYNSFIALAYGFAVAIGPEVAGALAEHGQWRWFFYMNLPICGVAALLVLTVDLRVPRRTFKEKMASLDWIGNFLVAASTASVVLALTWGGLEFAWTSFHVLVPLIVGLVGLVVFMIYEDIFPKFPLVPLEVLSSITGISGFIQTSLTQVYMLAVLYYLPVYYQACKDASPIGSGVDLFGLAFTLLPVGAVSGLSVTKSGRYRPQLWFAWICLVVGAGLLSTLHFDSSRGASIGYQIILGFGIGTLMTSTFFPVLAPLPVTLNAPALAFFMFVRFFSQVWGVTIGGAVLQNELRKRLPGDFVSQFPGGTSIAYSIIPVIRTLDEPLKTNVRIAFAESLRVLWQVLIGVAGLAFVASLFMKGLPLHTSVDKDWGLKESEKKLEDGNSVELGENRSDTSMAK